MDFVQAVRSLPAGSVPRIEDCRRVVGVLRDSLREVIVGQDLMVNRVVQAIILNQHVLLESLPGLGKTKLVRTAAELAGVKFKRIQYFPDMLPADLVGRYVLLPDGTTRVQWVYGPLFHSIVVADEINRASSKIQSATLEAMAERTCSLLERPRPLTMYHPDYRRYLKKPRANKCFGLHLPHPDDPERVFFVVFATQNPIEMEGTYPLSEAQVDRFLFKLLVDPLLPARQEAAGSEDVYDAILRVNVPNAAAARRPYEGMGELFADDEPLVADERKDPKFPVGKDGIPDWVKVACFFETIRHHILCNDHSMHDSLLNEPEKRGLYDRMKLILALTHYRSTEVGSALAGTGTMLPASLRNGFQETLRSFLAGWAQHGAGGDGVVTEAHRRVDEALTDDLMQYVDSGSSPRGLIDWPRAAAAEAFLAGDGEIRRKHLRAVAGDVLRHRVRLSPQARAEGVSTQDLIDLLLEALMPRRTDEDELKEDAVPLLA